MLTFFALQTPPKGKKSVYPAHLKCGMEVAQIPLATSQQLRIWGTTALGLVQQ